jgi:hypothetical protein
MRPVNVKHRILIFISLVSLAICGFAIRETISTADWTEIVEGIDYQEFRLPGPNRAFVTRMDRANPNLILDSSIAQGKLSGGTETVSVMANRYEQAINAWAPQPESSSSSIFPLSQPAKPSKPVYQPWGARNDVVVAINGTFFYTDTGVTIGGFLHSGWYAKQFGNLGGGSGFVWQQDRSAFIGECVYHPYNKQRITNLSTGRTLYFDGINFLREDQDLMIYTPQYDRDSQREGEITEVLVELTRTLGIRPYPDMTVGIVRQVSDAEGPIPIPFDHIVISAHKNNNRRKLRENYHVGDRIGISIDVVSLKEDCEEPLPLNWANTYASIGGSFFFLKDGEIQSFDNPGATLRHPRTAICYNSDYIYFVVVDGRQENYSIGMTMNEIARFCKNDLDATWGINQDGGGSSTMWIQGQVVNSPSDGSERRVANGFTMILVEPMERSDSFQVNDVVQTNKASKVWLGPGTNFAVHSSVPEGATGTIIPHMNDLNGVYAKGSYWWKVDFGSKVGWLPEEALLLINRPESITTLQISPIIQNID